MTTDRELLEVVSRVAGYPHGSGWLLYPEGSAPPQQHYWSPLTDDGDALRLAVKMEFVVDTHGLHTRVSLPYEDPICHELHGIDPCAATRRAIVRAAAAMVEGENSNG